MFTAGLSVARQDAGRRVRVVAMSSFGASRFTAMLATMAILGTAASMWWALEIRAGLKSGASNRSVDRPLPSKFAGRASRSKDERSNKFTSFSRNERPEPAPAVWNEERDQLPERSARSAAFVNYLTSGPVGGSAYMPIPIPPTRFELQALQGKSPEVPTYAPPLPVENPKRQIRDQQVRDQKSEPNPEPAAITTSNSPKLPTRTYYVEKFVEQGDAGEVKFRYRRQPCEPPNMPDVCFMSSANRRNIVVERR